MACSQRSIPAVKLEEAIRAAATSGQLLRIEDSTDFAWDELYVFGSYAEEEDIPKDLGDVRPGLVHVTSQHENLLVFVRDRKVVTSFYLPTEKAAFLANPYVRFTREEARFRVETSMSSSLSLNQVR